MRKTAIGLVQQIVKANQYFRMRKNFFPKSNHQSKNGTIMFSSAFARLKRKMRFFSVNRESDDAAKKYLNNLREKELSIGAAFKRGEAVHTAPGQIRSDVKVVVTKKRQVIPAAKNESALWGKKDDHDLAFATSLAVTMATDSPILGYAAGGSFSGAAVGAILNDCSSKDDEIE